MNPKKLSWKTNAAGVGTVLVAVGTLCKAIAEDNYGAAAAVLPALIAGLGLLFARDNDKSSEDVGAAK